MSIITDLRCLICLICSKNIKNTIKLIGYVDNIYHTIYNV